MKKKLICIGLTIFALVCVVGIILVCRGASQIANPGRDMDAITMHLSQYGNDHEEHVAAENLAVLSHHPDLKKLEPWYDFSDKVQSGKEAWVDMVSYTDEGDGIFYYLHYDGTDFYLVEDTTRDHFGTPMIVYEVFQGLYEFKEENENGILIHSAILCNREIKSMDHYLEMFWDAYTKWEASDFDLEVHTELVFPRSLFELSEP